MTRAEKYLIKNNMTKQQAIAHLKQVRRLCPSPKSSITEVTLSAGTDGSVVLTRETRAGIDVLIREIQALQTA